MLLRDGYEDGRTCCGSGHSHLRPVESRRMLPVLSGLDAEIAKQKAAEARDARLTADALMLGRLERSREPPVTGGE